MKNLEQAIVKALSVNGNPKYTLRQIAEKVGVFDKKGRAEINEILEQFRKAGIVVHIGRGKYKLHARHLNEQMTGRNYVVGRLKIMANGTAFVLPEPMQGQQSEQQDADDENGDIYVANGHLSNALPGDLVKVVLFPQRGERHREGEIVEVVERSRKPIVGIASISRKMVFVTPSDTAYRKDFLIPTRQAQHVKNGEKVVVSFVEWPSGSRSPIGKIDHVLGRPGENEVEMQAILVESEFPLDFSESAKREAAQIDPKISPDEIRKRRDFRQVTTFTIDPADAKDFDDALSFEVLENGLFRVGIHIADVSHYVKRNSHIDQEAYERGTSVYLVDRTIPMLPEILSNNLCSLRPHEDKLCFSAVFDLDENGKVHHEWFGKTIINSDRRFNYDEVQDIIEKGQGELSNVILQLHRIATALREERMNNNAINFETEEVKFQLDENGKPIGVYLKVAKESNWLVEEFMLLANKKVAEKVGKKTSRQKEIKTFVYRVHDEPLADKLDNFKTFAKKLGYDIRTGNRKLLVNSFNQMLEKSKETGEASMLNQLTIRLMARAVYSTKNIGHYGLAFPYYTHFTSPIRRYPDLMVHRLLEAYLQKKPSVNQEEYEQYCVHASQMEQKAVEAERTSVKYKQAEYLADRVGQEFDAVVSGIAKWGVFAEICESKCEGLIPMRKFDDDFYYIDEENYTLVGLHKDFSLRIGDPIRIRVVSVNILKKQMDFDLVK